MNILEQTVSMLEAMPEEARVRVFNYTQDLFTTYKPASPFKRLTTEEILSDLEESRAQIANGEGMNMCHQHRSCRAIAFGCNSQRCCFNRSNA